MMINSQQSTKGTNMTSIVPISQEKAFSRDLPKWPQMLVTGRKVEDDSVIKEIIFRTDEFLTSLYEYSGGNNCEWNRAYRERAGLNKLNEKIKGQYDLFAQVQNQIELRLKVLELCYADNNWASSSYVYGAHGWISPKGIIHYIDNVGKSPSVQDIYEEWVKIALAFPQLVCNITLMDKEHCEDDKQPVVSMQVLDGQVSLIDADPFELHSVTLYEQREFSIENLYSKEEQGLPEDWVHEFADRVRAVTDCLLEELESEAFEDCGD